MVNAGLIEISMNIVSESSRDPAMDLKLFKQSFSNECIIAS